MSRMRWVVLVAAAALALGACGDDDEGSEGAAEGAGASGEEAPGESGPSPEELARREYQEAVADTRTHLDLLATAHLADIDRGGAFIDFGTPARMKHTMGRWSNEWGSDASADGRTFTRLAETGKLWFHLDEASLLTLRLVLRKVGAPSVVLYLNDETLRTVDLEDGVRTYDVPVPREHVRAGENELMLRATGTQQVGNEQVSLELDSVHVIRGAPPPADLAPPGYAQLVQREAGPEGDRRAAVVLPAGTTASWYVQVPEQAKLALGVSGTEGAGLRIHARPALGQRSELLAVDPSASWTDRAVSLADHAGKVVRLDVEATGDAGQVALGEPQIIVPLPERGRPDAQARNVVVLTIDTLRASKLRPYNPDSRVQTPAFDAFVEDATLFESPQAPENWTKPSVASILTSLFPMTHNTKRDAASLPDAALTLGEIYQEAGFDTAAFLANGYVSDRFGFKQGWDHYTNYIREGRSTEAEKVFEEAAEWIEANKDDRFFVYIQTIDPHVPYDPPDEYLRMYDPNPEQYTGIVRNRSTGNQLGDAKTGRLTFSEADAARLEALHDGEISYHDHHFGQFVAKLRELGLYDDTIFVITSDHGEEFQEHGSWGHGHSVYQELLHVPLVVRWKPADAAGTRIGDVVSTMDIAPTVLEAIGVAVPEVFEGKSLLGYVHGAPPPGPAVAFSDFLDDRRVIRAGRWKLILRGNLTWTMFDLEEDPGEQRQLDRNSVDPVALRYTRILLGQLLGAHDRTDWLHTGEGSAPRVLPQQDSQIDAELCQQLSQLGYVDARCDAL